MKDVNVLKEGGRKRKRKEKRRVFIINSRMKLFT